VCLLTGLVLLPPPPWLWARHFWLAQLSPWDFPLSGNTPFVTARCMPTITGGVTLASCWVSQCHAAPRCPWTPQTERSNQMCLVRVAIASCTGVFVGVMGMTMDAREQQQQQLQNQRSQPWQTQQHQDMCRGAEGSRRLWCCGKCTTQYCRRTKARRSSSKFIAAAVNRLMHMPTS